MVLTTIYLTRHGFRVNWIQNPATGEYYTNVQSPTRIPSDPPLAAYGVDQAKQLAERILVLDPRPSRIYSSPFYRCLETLRPTVESLGGDIEMRGDNGLGEWYGRARFDHPHPGDPSLLRKFFPTYALDYKPSIIPSQYGETLIELHNRCAYAMAYIISEMDKEENIEAILICTHAASLIAIGRALAGNMPEDMNSEDFKPYTCGLTKFVRREASSQTRNPRLQEWEGGDGIPEIDWQDGKGIAGGWDCVLNGDCSHLKGGAERGWHFSGDENYFTGPLEAESGLVAQYSSKSGTHHPSKKGGQIPAQSRVSKL